MASTDSPSTSLPQTPHRLKVTSEVDLVDFAVQVFKIDKEVANEIRDKRLWALEEADLQTYEKSKDSEGFLTLANAFLTKVHCTLARGRALKPTSRANIKEEATGTEKRGRCKRAREEDPADENGHGAKRARTSDSDDASTKLSNEGVTLLSKPQCLACSSHYFIVEIKVRDFQVTVAYYDQFLEFVVAGFDLRERPQDLALVLYGTNAIEANRAGVDPHLRKWSPYMPVSEGKTGMFFNGTHKCAALCGRSGYLRVPSTGKPADALDTKSSWPIGLNKDWIGSYFEIKQGTDSLSFEITDVLQQPAQLLGDATVVYEMKLAAKNGVPLSPSEARTISPKLLKVSWPLDRPRDSDASDGESSRIVMLNGSLKFDNWPKEVIDLVIPPLRRFKSTYTADDLNLSWKRLNLELEGMVTAQLNRKLQIEVEEYCRPWCEVDNAEELVEVWRQCIKRHNDVYKKTGFLHRNISDTSIMFYRSNGKVRGVLKDWDKAAQDGRKGSAVPTNRTFMALDLLKDGTKKYHHRHDLEAFFYTLIWAAVHYDLKTKSSGPTTFWLLHRWVEGDKERKCLLFDPKCTKHNSWGHKAIRPEFKQILEPGIRPLCQLFNSGFKKLGYWDELHIFVDFETCGGALAYGTFMAVVRKLQEGLKGKKEAVNDFGT